MNQNQFMLRLENEILIFQAKNVPRMGIDEYMEIMLGKMIPYWQDDNRLVWEPIEIFSENWVLEDEDGEYNDQ